MTVPYDSRACQVKNEATQQVQEIKMERIKIKKEGQDRRDERNKGWKHLSSETKRQRAEPQQKRGRIGNWREEEDIRGSPENARQTWSRIGRSSIRRTAVRNGQAAVGRGKAEAIAPKRR